VASLSDFPRIFVAFLFIDERLSALLARCAQTREIGALIVLARTRLTAPCGKSASQAARIRKLTPTINAALAGRQRMKSIRKWLNRTSD